MNNDFNQMGSMPNQNMNYGQPMNNGMQPQPMQGAMPMQQPMANQPMASAMPAQQPTVNQIMNNGQGFGYNYQPAKKFTFPPIAKDTVSIIGYVGALLMILGSFLNFATIKATANGTLIVDNSLNYFYTADKLCSGALILIFGLAVLALVHFRKNLIAIAPTAIAGIILLMDFTEKSKEIKEFKESYGAISSWFGYEVKASFGPAPFIIFLGIIAIIVHVVLYVMNKKKAQQGPVQMMNGMPNQNMNYGQPMNNGMQPQQMPMQQPMAGPQPMPGPMPQQPMPAQQPMNYNPNNQYPNNNMMM